MKLIAKWFVCGCLMILYCVPVGAQDRENDVTSPRKSIQSLYYQISGGVNNPKLATDLLNASWLDADERIQRVEQLQVVLEAKGLLPEMESIPDDPNFVDSNLGKSVYEPFKSEPRIFLEKVGSSWLVSGTTVGSIPDMYSEVLPFGLTYLIQKMPEQGAMIFGIYVWQLIGFGLILLIGFVIAAIVRAVAIRIFKRLLVKWKMPADSVMVLQSMGKPLALFIWVFLVGLLQPILGLPVSISAFIILTIKFALPVIAIFMAYRFVDLISYRAAQLAERTQSTLDDQLIPLLRKALKFIVILVGLILLLQHLGFDITALLAGVSIGGLALAFAAQDTIRNLFGSVMLFIDRPFTVGDWVAFESVEGNIEEVGFRSTRIRTMADTIISVPNGRLADLTVDNYGLRVFRRYRTTLGVEYSTSPELLAEFIVALRKIITDHPATAADDPRSLVHFREFGASSLNIEVQLYINSSEMASEWQAREEINMAFLETANRMGVSYAFPSQSLYLESVPETSTLYKG
ncbi:MAG: mechanosensitive ion channel [Ignavibacteria bacterium]|nr:mechanosensitive ion channel [Ignavibacteria bacterium]